MMNGSIHRTVRLHSATGQRRQQGYAMLMVIFFTALLLLVSMTAAPRILLEGKRDKEQEMIWRGKQYIRGVRMYYRKMGRFPTTVEDLTKPKVGSLRFMRQAYKDPMNAADGTWRLIYVGPSGQLIGSLKPPQTLQLPGRGAGLGTSAAAMANASHQSGSQPPGSSTFGNSPGTPSGTGAASPSGGGSNPPGDGNSQSGTGGTGAAGSTPGSPTDANGQPTDPNASGGTPDASNSQDTPTIIGGNIIGVGSKIAGRSVIVYEKATNYRLFEFIWDPSKDATIAGQPGMQTGTGLGQTPGLNPAAAPPVPANTNPSQPSPAPSNPQPNPAPPDSAPLDSTPPPETAPQN
jgi:hypothetical protein